MEFRWRGFPGGRGARVVRRFHAPGQRAPVHAGAASLPGCRPGAAGLPGDVLSVIGGVLLLAAAAPAGELGEGVFGAALDAGDASVSVAATPAYVTLPLTFECRARLGDKGGHNILAACCPKASVHHWELFTTPGDGFLCAYLPGRRPDHARTSVDLADGKWHAVAMHLDVDRVTLFVDGAERAAVALSPAPAGPAADAFAIGALVERTIPCNGLLDEVRLSAGLRPIDGVPGAPLAADAATIGLWPLDRAEAGRVANLVAGGAPGQLAARAAAAGPVMPRMSTALQPLPPGEDAAPARALLEGFAREAGLTGVKAGEIRDGVLREWLHDYTWHGKLEHPEHRTPWFRGSEDIGTQVYDSHALVRPGEGPLETVLRRALALAAHLERQGGRSGPGSAGEALGMLRKDVERTMPARDSEAYRARYLAACALRREVALANPLLDFDAILCVARGTFAGSVRSNPMTADAQGGHLATQYFGCNALPGGGLYLVRNYKGQPQVADVTGGAAVQDGRLRGARLDHGAFATPDLSFDGRTIAFAWTENTEHRWSYGAKSTFHLFRVNTDGSDLRQLTDGGHNDFDPCWLPNGRVAFVSERRGGHIRCFDEYLKVRNYTLFSIRDDGSDIVPMSYFETSEWNPTVNNEGQVVFTRWDYTDRENCLGTRMWLCRQDGGDPRAPHGNYPLPYHTFPDRTPWKVQDGREIDSRLGAPLVEMGIRAVPGSARYIMTAAPHHGEAFGSLCMLDLHVPDDGHMAQVRRITPDEPFPESESGGRRHYKYGSPWPLSEDFYLCNAWENLVLLDRFGNKEVLCELALLPCAQDERLRIIDPIPVRPRRRPPTAGPPSRAEEAGGAPRGATIAVMDVYDSDLPFPEGTRIKWLRVTQNILKANHAMGVPMIGYERENTPRIPLGVVPVEEDGSAYLEAPVAKELIFQALDENYMAVQSMRAVAFVHPGEQLTCQGCHEPVQKAPAVRRTPLALRRAPSRLRPELGAVEPISYYRQVRPIVEGRCLPCHVGRKKGPQDMSYEALKEGHTFWFSGAMWQQMASDYSGVHGGSRTIPGRFGARNSRIGRALMDEGHRQAVPEAERHALILWLDSNSLRLGAYIREGAQLRGELVWPELDVDPANVSGVEGRGAPLRNNFWHENLWGPRKILATSHALQKVCIFDEQGERTWDYDAPNPQDVWMLPNGNILTTWLHGVREVTRDRRVVWEYRVEPPDEVPTCQPLPDGKILVGIVGQCRLVEVDRRNHVSWELRLATTAEAPHAQFRMCRKTEQGTYLVPFTAEGAVREYAADGKVVRGFPAMPAPVCALRLEDGHTLISAGRAVTEYDAGDRVVWELTEADVPDLNIATPAGIQRLPNGNTVVCNWNAADAGGKLGAHVFEVTPDKRVVWHVAGPHTGRVAQCQLLNPDLTPRQDGIRR